MICDDCGETNKPGTEFCLFCGAYLGWQAQENPPGANDVTQTLPIVGSTDRAAPAAPEKTVPQPAPAAVQHVAPRPAPRPAVGATSVARPTKEPQHQPTPAEAPAPPPPPAPPAPAGCPSCGRIIEGDRRFCGHCGEQFIHPGTQAPVTRPARKRDTWWTRFWDNKDRVARRAYRRSLPPLYRWRRVIIAVLALGLIGAGLTVIGRSPKSFVLARYNDIRNILINVPDVQASIIPPEASAESTPDLLVDNSEKPWQMNWTARTKGSPCGQTPTTAVIQLSFAETRIRAIDMRAGILAKYPSRPTQYRPKTIWIAYGNECHEFPLVDLDRQPVALDTKVPVSSVRISVMTAYAPTQPAGAQELLSFTEITLRARPPVR